MSVIKRVTKSAVTACLIMALLLGNLAFVNAQTPQDLMMEMETELANTEVATVQEQRPETFTEALRRDLYAMLAAPAAFSDELPELNELVNPMGAVDSVFDRSPAIQYGLTVDADIEAASRLRGIEPSRLLTEYGVESVEPFNTNPNLAIFLPESFMGLDLFDLANHQERWYHFDVAAGRKIYTTLWYESGIYDLYLFRLNGSTLSLVAHSLNGTGFERLSYISQTGGHYFIAVAPFVPTPNPHMFHFIVDITSGFDQYELNDFRNQATTFTNRMDITANLDGRFDEDWYRLNITAAGNRTFSVTDAPASQYGLFIFNSNLNQLAGVFAGGTPVTLNLPVGTYYILIRSITGHTVADNYRLRVTPQFEISGNDFFVNGNRATLNRRYEEVNLGAPLHIRHLRETGNIGNLRTLDNMGVFSTMQHNSQFFSGTVVVIEAHQGFIHDFDNRFWPMSWFHTTTPSYLADNHSRISFLYLFVCINTGNLVHAIPIL